MTPERQEIEEECELVKKRLRALRKGWKPKPLPQEEE